MTRRGFLAGLGSLPFLGFLPKADAAKRAEAVEAKEAPIPLGGALDSIDPNWRNPSNMMFELPGEMFTDGESRTVFPGSGSIVKSRDIWRCMAAPKGGVG